ncbi:hypothetical protein [Candidatus Vidania fulgoroideorum]
MYIEKINIFDLDKTLLSIDCENEFLIYLYKIKKINKKIFKKFKCFFREYDLGKLNFKKYTIFLYKNLKKIKGIKKIIKRFCKKVKKKRYIKLYKILKHNNYVITTASNYEIVKYVCRYVLKKNILICNNYKKNFYNYKKKKVINLLRFIIKKKGTYKTTFFTDSINDIYMTRFSDSSVLVNPDKFFFKNNKFKKLFLERVF